MKKEENSPIPEIGEEQINLLERLCNANAVSGDEKQVRQIVLDELKALAAEIKVDALGNVLVTCRGTGESLPRFMLAAHMDEVGFMLVSDEGDGAFRFETVGGLDVRQLVGKSVQVGQENVPGVIGARPIHLLSSEEARRAIQLESLRIDMGTSSTKVKIGDRAAFGTSFARLGPSIRAKALDNRLGVATLIELVKNAPKNVDLMAAFTVQEEVGLRGARVAAYAFDPDLAIAVDSVPAYDLPTWDGEENRHFNTQLGFGPAIYVADGSTISDPRLVRFLIETAEAHQIPYQIRQPGGGGTDAGAIHRQRAGIPSVSVSVPGRYAHSSAGIARVSDWQSTLALLYTAIREFDPKTLKTW